MTTTTGGTDPGGDGGTNTGGDATDDSTGDVGDGTGTADVGDDSTDDSGTGDGDPDDGNTDDGDPDDGDTDDGDPGDDDTGTDDGSDDTGTDDGSDDTGTDDGSDDTGTDDGSDDTGTDDGSDDTGTDDGSDDTGTDDGGDSGTDDGGDDGGDGPDVPPPAGSCPTFTDGTLTFNPSGGARSVRVWVDTAAAASQDGPVVLYWYGTGGQPTQAQQALGDGISTITSMGGIVAAPVHANGGTFPWLGGGTADYQLADEIIGCAEQEIGIDQRQIHSLGFSAGGLFTSQLSFARSSYFASVATYSGGGNGNFQDSSNKFAAMIFHGGPSDNVFGQNFVSSSDQYQSALSSNGNFAFICNHGSGHSMPGSDGRSAVMQFFLDHPYGTDPSPYDGSFPGGIPSYCAQP